MGKSQRQEVEQILRKNKRKLILKTTNLKTNSEEKKIRPAWMGWKKGEKVDKSQRLPPRTSTMARRMRRITTTTMKCVLDRPWMGWQKVERVNKSQRQRSSLWKTDDTLSTAGSSTSHVYLSFFFSFLFTFYILQHPILFLFSVYFLLDQS